MCVVDNAYNGYKFDACQKKSIYNIEFDDLVGFKYDFDFEDLNIYYDKNGVSYTCILSQEKIKIGDIVVICDKCHAYYKKVALDRFNMTKCQSCRKDISAIKPKSI